MAAATATAAASAAAGRAARRFGGGTVGAGSSEDRKLDLGFLAGALRAGDCLLLIDDDFFKLGLTVFADVFVNRHS